MQNLLKPIRDAIEQKTTTFKPADILPRIVEIDKLIAENLTIVEQTTRDLLAIAKLAASRPLNQEVSLEAAIAGLEDRYAEGQRARLAEQLAASRREAGEKPAKSKAGGERRIAEAKAALPIATSGHRKGQYRSLGWKATALFLTLIAINILRQGSSTPTVYFRVSQMGSAFRAMNSSTGRPSINWGRGTRFCLPLMKIVMCLRHKSRWKILRPETAEKCGHSSLKRKRSSVRKNFARASGFNFERDSGSTYFCDADTHPPRPLLNGQPGRGTLVLSAKLGSVVELSSTDSTDPDGDSLQPRWWFYPEASSYRGSVEFAGADTQQAKVTIPADAANQTLHIILELQDSGSPPLTRYRRAVIRIEQ